MGQPVSFSLAYDEDLWVVGASGPLALLSQVHSAFGVTISSQSRGSASNALPNFGVGVGSPGSCCPSL